MGAGALILQNNSGHNVLALQKKAPQDLVALATLYYTTQVAEQVRGMEEAKRRDISRFLAFYYDLFRHYHPRDWQRRESGRAGLCSHCSLARDGPAGVRTPRSRSMVHL